MGLSCEICGQRPPRDNVALLRLNKKGISGRWTCDGHAWRFSSYAKRIGRRLPLSDEEINNCVNEYKVEHETFRSITLAKGEKP